VVLKLTGTRPLLPAPIGQARRESAHESGPDQAAGARHRIRSFVLRQGRFTPAQQRAFESQWPRFGVDFLGPEAAPDGRDLSQLYDQERPIVFELGFGNGEALLHGLSQAPQYNYLGVEVHLPGVGRLLHALHESAAGRIRVYRHDAVEVLQHEVRPASLAEVRIYFPDPWHKKRHQKRRLLQADFLALVVSRLQPGGILHLATDWQDYALQMLAVCNGNPQLSNLAPDAGYVARPETRPLTHFEQRGVKLGHGVWDLLYRKS